MNSFVLILDFEIFNISQYSAFSNMKIVKDDLISPKNREIYESIHSDVMRKGNRSLV